VLVASQLAMSNGEASLYNIFTYILLLLQTKGYRKREVFPSVSGDFPTHTLDHLPYKSLELATSQLVRRDS
jgi:hypothetical protein